MILLVVIGFLLPEPQRSYDTVVVSGLLLPEPQRSYDTAGSYWVPIT